SLRGHAEPPLCDRELVLRAVRLPRRPIDVAHRLSRRIDGSALLMPTSNSSETTERVLRARWDVVTGGTLMLLVALYCWLLPHALGTSDEGIFLYEAKRVAEGAVFYRDVFDIITPLSTFVLAGLFAVFGATVTTARVADALVHGAIVAGIFGVARRLGV